MSFGSFPTGKKTESVGVGAAPKKVMLPPMRMGHVGQAGVGAASRTPSRSAVHPYSEVPNPGIHVPPNPQTPYVPTGPHDIGIGQQVGQIPGVWDARKLPQDWLALGQAEQPGVGALLPPNRPGPVPVDPNQFLYCPYAWQPGWSGAPIFPRHTNQLWKGSVILSSLVRPVVAALIASTFSKYGSGTLNPTDTVDLWIFQTPDGRTNVSCGGKVVNGFYTATGACYCPTLLIKIGPPAGFGPLAGTVGQTPIRPIQGPYRPPVNQTSIQSELAMLQGQASRQPYQDADGSYSSYVQGMQQAGIVAVNQLGPNIDRTYGVQSGTQVAWGLNGQLANVNNGNASGYPSAQASDAAQAQGLLTQMVIAYQQAVTAGQAAQQLHHPRVGIFPSPITALSPFPADVVSAAQAAVAAINSDPNYCTSVSTSGTAVNIAVHNFKDVWNAAGLMPALQHNGKYDAACAGDLAQVLGSSPPAACQQILNPPAALLSAAQSVYVAMQSSANYCGDVSRSGSPVWTAVHNFKVAWNSANVGTALVDNGLYDAACASALAQVLGSPYAPAACGAPVHIQPRVGPIFSGPQNFLPQQPQCSGQWVAYQGTTAPSSAALRLAIQINGSMAKSGQKLPTTAAAGIKTNAYADGTLYQFSSYFTNGVFNTDIYAVCTTVPSPVPGPGGFQPGQFPRHQALAGVGIMPGSLIGNGGCGTFKCSTCGRTGVGVMPASLIGDGSCGTCNMPGWPAGVESATSMCSTYENTYQAARDYVKYIEGGCGVGEVSSEVSGVGQRPPSHQHPGGGSSHQPRTQAAGYEASRAQTPHAALGSGEVFGESAWPLTGVGQAAPPQPAPVKRQPVPSPPASRQPLPPPPASRQPGGPPPASRQPGGPPPASRQPPAPPTMIQQPPPATGQPTSPNVPAPPPSSNVPAPPPPPSGLPSSPPGCPAPVVSASTYCTATAESYGSALDQVTYLGAFPEIDRRSKKRY